MKRFIYLTAILVILGSGILWWQYSIRPLSNSSTPRISFIVKKGTSIRQIAANLEDNRLVRNRYAFILAVKILGIENSLQAGSFKLSSAMDTMTIAKTLTKGRSDIRITIPEGKRAEEIVGIISSYLPVEDKSGWIVNLSQHEGFLFPDTYDFPDNASADTIIRIMRDEFDEQFNKITPTVSMTQRDLIIIASMIEREARHDQDRALISSVIHNRLNIGMKLDIDSTIQYALGYDYGQRTWWKNNLTANDLAIDSPYNTYLNPGLPPTPIANPGFAALQAAANPANTNYLFYFTDGEGINHYAKTLEEQNDNIDTYGL